MEMDGNASTIGILSAYSVTCFLLGRLCGHVWILYKEGVKNKEKERVGKVGEGAGSSADNTGKDDTEFSQEEIDMLFERCVEYIQSVDEKILTNVEEGKRSELFALSKLSTTGFFSDGDEMELKRLQKKGGSEAINIQNYIKWKALSNNGFVQNQIDAKALYVGLVTQIFPEWASNSDANEQSSVAEEEENKDRKISSEDLDKLFKDSANLAASAMSSGAAKSVKNDQKLHLYALYKIATQGKVVNDDEKPALYEITARAKWDAWKALSQEESITDKESAKKLYIEYVKELLKSLNIDASSLSNAKENSTSTASGAASSTTNQKQDSMGHGVSMPKVGGTGDEWEEGTDIFYFTSTGNKEKVLEMLRSGEADLNAQDEDGRTVLHWAADRGNLDLVNALLSDEFKGKIDVNVKDVDDMTPYAYSTMCGYPLIAKALKDFGADTTES